MVIKAGRGYGFMWFLVSLGVHVLEAWSPVQYDDQEVVYFCVCVVLGLEFRAYTLSHFTSPFFVMGVFKLGSPKLFPGLALNLDLPDPCLLSS
jgi:hypothetical protein